MNALATIQNISKEDLNYLLPKSLLDVLEDKDSCYSSPQSIKNNDVGDDLYQITSMNFTPSPQIPPLESRLHSYLLRKNIAEDSAKPCNLSKFFDEINIDNEIESALKSIPQRVKIYEYLEENSFFKYVADTVLNHENNIKPKLNAQAISFIPDYEKENICPRKLKKNNLN